MNLKEKIDQFFKSYKKQISIDELIKKFDIKKDEVNLLLDVLYNLERAGKIFYDDNQTYMHVPKEFYLCHGILHKSNTDQFFIKTEDGCRITVKGKNLIEGKNVFVSINRNNKHPKSFEGRIVRTVKREYPSRSHSFIISGVLKKEDHHFYIRYDDKKIYIPKENLNTAFAGDTVNVWINENVGNVIEILNRYHNRHVFECKKINGVNQWVPIGPSYGVYSLNEQNFEPGDMVVAEMKENGLKFIKKINKKDSVQDEIDALIIDFGFSHEFPETVLEKVRKISDQIDEEEIRKREDLRNLETITIDPADAKDLDDGVSLQYENGIYHLYVHTADPSYYVKINSEIFKEAFRRTFSLYPSSDVIPMLPKEISDNVCSLNENGDKLATTFKFDLDEKGNILDFKVFKSIIKNNKQMDYDTVNECLNGNIEESYIPYLPTLYRLRDLSCILQDLKVSRGAISLEKEERNIIVDDLGNPISIHEKSRGDAQLMIENIMVLANEHITKFAYYLNLPFVYRNHEKPTVQKEINLKNNLVQRGYFIQKLGNIDRPELLQKIVMNLLKGRSKEERKFISEIILQSMTRAYYDYKSIGHYGLALDHYGTFTSPIRKISDLLNHMVIDEFLENGIESKKMDIYRDMIENSCEYISEKQKDADFLEQEIDALLLSKYAESFLGEEVNARILFISKNQVYIKDDHELTGVLSLNKKAMIKNHNLILNDKIYKQNDIIKVYLKEVKDQELIFDMNVSLDKKLIKK